MDCFDLTPTLSLMPPLDTLTIPSFKGGRQGSFIDYILISGSLFAGFQGSAILESAFSDHNPVCLSLGGRLLVTKPIVSTPAQV